MGTAAAARGPPAHPSHKSRLCLCAPASRFKPVSLFCEACTPCAPPLQQETRVPLLTAFPRRTLLICLSVFPHLLMVVTGSYSSLCPQLLAQFRDCGRCPISILGRTSEQPTLSSGPDRCLGGIFNSRPFRAGQAPGRFLKRSPQANRPVIPNQDLCFQYLGGVIYMPSRSKLIAQTSLPLYVGCKNASQTLIQLQADLF